MITILIHKNQTDYKRKKGNNKFYVYLHQRLKNCEPFYIGRGNGERAYSKINRNKFWQSIVKSDEGLMASILKNNLTIKKANFWERYYIKKYGRKALGGLLVNETDGGDGMCGYKPSKETLKKKSIAITGKILKPVNEDILVKDYSFDGMTLKKLSKKYNLSIGKLMKHIPKLLRQQKRIENSKKNGKKSKGKIPWNKGYGDYMIGEKNHFWGKKHSVNSILKMSNAKTENKIYNII